MIRRMNQHETISKQAKRHGLYDTLKVKTNLCLVKKRVETT